ncbi:MAG: DUF2213 domain-containing protein [Ardenticatenales bacterium]|nr:DUF2213 domain-containing protein [Ardenticatenales bacterium]
MLIVHRTGIEANARYESLQGRRYLVAPMVAVVAGVLNGQLLHPDQLSNFVQAWNGRPLVVYHPQDESGGYVSANSPQILESYGVGFFFNASFSEGRMRGEAWLDVARIEALGGEALQALQRVQRGEVIEVSTAYFCHVQDTRGEYNGKPYTGAQIDLKPDHVAILPNEIGACSVQDGCGLGRFNSAKDQSMSEDTIKTPQGEPAPQGDGAPKTEAPKTNKDCSDKTPAPQTEAPAPVKANEDGDAAPAPQTEAPAPQGDPVLDGLRAFVQEFGGFDGLREIIGGIKANAQAERADLIAKIAANRALGLTAEDLQGLKTEALRKMARAGVTADYSGAGGTVKANATQDQPEFVIYKAPVL